MHPTASILAAFAPTGKLRAAINLGNPILAAAGGDGGARGVSVDLARAFARVLGVDLELAVVDAAGKSVDAVASERADIAFTAAYVLIEGCYLVKDDSTIPTIEDVDRLENRVVAGKGSSWKPTRSALAACDCSMAASW
jgi:polar amino acid transport system substrate-binding protein